MRTIASQNNERHRLMAEKAARYLNLIPGDTQALNSIIEMEREPSPETGREHIKKALTILFPHLKNRVQDMFSSSCDDERSSCYVANEEVNGFDVPYIRVLEELKREYPKGIVLLAHPWRYDSEFRFANKPKAAQGRLRDMSEFVPELARQDLIRGLEIYGYYLIPKHLRDMDLQDLIENHVPGNVQHSVRCPLKLDKDTGKEYTIKHLRYIGTRYRLIAERVNEARKREGGRLSEIRFLCAGGNDSHGEELPGGKPDIPIGYGCRETDPLPFDMTGIRHTPARPIPAIGSLSR